MERHRCKQCYRRFASGRALAGHMRSHVSHAMPSRPRPGVGVRARPLPSPSASSSSPHPPAKSVDEEAPPEFSSNSAFQERESDAESSLNRRPKRLRAELPAIDEPLSSVSDASSEEDVARCLMLLSRDAWSKSEAEERQSNGCDEVDGEEYEEEGIGTGSRRRRRNRFRCGTCRKVFRSYQALGGHRASHKRVGVECVPITAMTPIHGEDSSGGATAAHHSDKLWECPYCYRVFGSGQALGGHKRSHLSSSATAISTPSPAIPLPHPRSPYAAAAVAKNNSSGIDLNLPAPTEDEVELSALSVATDLSRK